MDCSMELIESPEKNLLVASVLAEIHCIGHEFPSQTHSAIGRVQDEPAQLRRSPLPVDNGYGAHDLTGCLRNPETVRLGVELAYEFGDSPSHFDLEGPIKAVVLGIEGSMEEGYIAGIADPVGTDVD